MKPIYYIEIYEYDYCNSWTNDVLHTTNKKFLDDLCAKWTNKYGEKDTRSFSVLELKVVDTPSHNDIDYVEKFYYLK